MRFAVGCSQITLFKVDGTDNCANSLTKPLTADQLTSEKLQFIKLKWNVIGTINLLTWVNA
jgi:hypothetical protein